LKKIINFDKLLEKRFYSFLFILLIPVLVPGVQSFFKQATQLPEARENYGTVAVGGYLYVIGGTGVNSGNTGSVIKAKINPDGTLQQWENTTRINFPISYINNQVVSYKNNIYITAGYNSAIDNNVSFVMWSSAGKNGELSTWRKSSPYPGRGISCGVAVVTDGFIHLIGGNFGEREPADNIWSAKIAEDGSIQDWKIGQELPTPLWHHCGEISDGKIWLWGGLTDAEPNSVNNVIYEAQLLPAGRIGKWQVSKSKLPEAFYGAACAVSGSYLLSFCPRYEGISECSDIWYALCKPDGLSSWKKIQNKLPVKLYVAVASDYSRGNIYIPGGRIRKEPEEYDPNVYYFSLTGKKKVRRTSNIKEYGSNPIPSPEMTRPVKTGIPVHLKQDSFMQNPFEPTPVQKTLAPGITVQNTPAPATPAPTTPAPDVPAAVAGDIPGFLGYKEARVQSLNKSKPIVLYFYRNNQECIQESMNLQPFNSSALNGRVLLAKIDIDTNPDLPSLYGVTVVPVWIFFDASGYQKFKVRGIQNVPDLQNNILQIFSEN
jgi:hypothetical protein